MAGVPRPRRGLAAAVALVVAPLQQMRQAQTDWEWPAPLA